MEGFGRSHWERATVISEADRLMATQSGSLGRFASVMAERNGRFPQGRDKIEMLPNVRSIHSERDTFVFAG